jgi:guanylate kinase
MSAAGKLIVISAPSGGGKTTVIRAVLKASKHPLRYSVSATTRKKRSGETDKKDYLFLGEKAFGAKADKGEFVEWEEVHGNYYGTLRGPLDAWLADGCRILLDLDVKGGLRVKQKFGDRAVLIFIAPPSFDSLVARLRGRNSETEAQIKKRLSRYPDEIAMSQYYDHVIVNENLATTVNKVIEIISHQLEA